jgi:Methyltransferase domain
MVPARSSMTGMSSAAEPGGSPSYAESYAAQYNSQSFELLLVAARRRRVLSSLAGHPHDRVVEVGCGLEPLFPYVDRFSSYTVVEPEPTFAEAAAQVADGLPSVSVVTARLEDVARELIATRPDFVILSSLLHEVSEPRVLLQAIRTICTPETVVHVNVPNVMSFHRLLAVKMGLIADPFQQSEMERRFGRHERFDLAALLALARDMSFEVIESGSYFVKPFTNYQMDLLLDTVDRESLLDGLDRMIEYMPDLGSELYADIRPNASA